MNSILLSDYLKNQTTTRDALNENIGDGFLLKRNPLFAGVRRSVLKLGFDFTTNPSFDYYAWPMISLEKVISRKEIPYRANLTALKNFEKEAPRRFLLKTALLVPPAKNHLFHESAHVLANAAWKKVFKSSGQSPRDQKKFIMRYLFGEACANATELTAFVYADSPEHLLNLGMNNYLSVDARSAGALKRVAEALGVRATLELNIFFYIFSHCFVGISRSSIKSLVRTVLGQTSASEALVADLQVISKKACDLSFDFRTKTTAGFLAAQGINVAIKTLVPKNPKAMLEESRRLLDVVRDFSLRAFDHQIK